MKCPVPDALWAASCFPYARDGMCPECERFRIEWSRLQGAHRVTAEALEANAETTDVDAFIRLRANEAEARLDADVARLRFHQRQQACSFASGGRQEAVPASLRVSSVDQMIRLH